jgi:lysozyme
MKLDNDGYSKLHQREGLKLKPYLDTKGIPTIAIGNTYYLDGTKVTMKDKALTMDEAKELGKVTADDFAKNVSLMIKSTLNQNQFNALVSLAYNIGKNGFKNSTVLKLVNENPNNPLIKNAFMMWTKNKELIGRRKDEVKQYFKS